MTRRTEHTRSGGTHYVTPKRPKRSASTEHSEEKTDGADSSQGHRGSD